MLSKNREHLKRLYRLGVPLKLTCPIPPGSTVGQVASFNRAAAQACGNRLQGLVLVDDEPDWSKCGPWAMEGAL
eukprot:2075862-Lingulodinium_polyedra.AAC.1